MKNEYKKIILIVFLVVLIYPSITLAVWWNPFSWFKKDKKVSESKHEVVIEAEVAPVESKVIIDKEKTPILSKETEKKINLVSDYQPPVIPIITPIVASNVTPVESNLNTLSIRNIEADAEAYSVKIKWETTIDSESKIMIEGDTYFSEKGVGKYHVVNIGGLESDIPYMGNITALADNSWKTERVTFSTKQTPLKIDEVNHSCNAEKCIISWKTNYPSESSIKIYQGNDSKIYSSLESKKRNSRNHEIQTTLPKGFNYKVIIRAENESGSTEINSGFSIISCVGGTGFNVCTPASA
ncbi:MAG: hypothetical protein K9M36_00610 [Candidatus Pacebacteria bacterium]|nr:hypothetical protein [Candidatus Paceibacterota bacterium]